MREYLKKPLNAVIIAVAFAGFSLLAYLHMVIEQRPGDGKTSIYEPDVLDR